MSDINTLLMEIHGILGNSSKVEEIEASESTPADAARKYFNRGLTTTDLSILQSLSKMEWSDIAEMASLAALPTHELVFMAMSLLEGTMAFRQAWHDLHESYPMPFVLSRGSFISAARVAPTPDAFVRVVGWSRVLADEMSDRQLSEAAKKTPAVMYDPADDKSSAKKASDTTKGFMTPHEHGVESPNKKKSVMTPRLVAKPGDEDTKRKKDLKQVNKAISKMEKEAKKLGKSPEEAFPMAWTDLQREKVRMS